MEQLNLDLGKVRGRNPKRRAHKPTIPEVMERLLLLAREADAHDIFLGDEIRACVADLPRRKRVRKAPAKARKITDQLREKLRRYALAHPDMSYQEIGAKHGVNAGRVSEALAGYR